MCVCVVPAGWWTCRGESLGYGTNTHCSTHSQASRVTDPARVVGDVQSQHANARPSSAPTLTSSTTPPGQPEDGGSLPLLPACASGGAPTRGRPQAGGHSPGPHEPAVPRRPPAGRTAHGSEGRARCRPQSSPVTSRNFDFSFGPDMETLGPRRALALPDCFGGTCDTPHGSSRAFRNEGDRGQRLGWHDDACTTPGSLFLQSRAGSISCPSP